MASASVIDPDIIITNLHRRYTGVSGTINALLPVQSRNLRIGFVGTDLPGAKIAATVNPSNFVRLSLWQAIRLSRQSLAHGRKRIWHVRRDPEMIIGIVLRDLLRFPIRLAFTSAAKHRHSWFPQWLISRMDAVIATTPEAAAFVPNTTKVVFHGASLDRFSPPEDKQSAWRQSGLPGRYGIGVFLSGIHISEPTRLRGSSYAVFCLKKKKEKTKCPEEVKLVTEQYAVVESSGRIASHGRSLRVLHRKW